MNEDVGAAAKKNTGKNRVAEICLSPNGGHASIMEEQDEKNENCQSNK